ncbi:MAG: TIGR02147 family protein [Myxococcota bacterium]
MPIPAVFSYLDYRAYLRDWFEARKREQPDYSYATFARDGGGSKAALANVLAGSRAPRASTLDAFARAMALAPNERNYLGLLVELSLAQNLTERREAMGRILASEQYGRMKHSESAPDADVARYLEHWYVPVIREMVGLPGFRDDPEWIAAALVPVVTRDEVVEALATLFDLGFLFRAADGTVQQREIRFSTGVEASQLAVSRYHREVPPDLMRAVDPLRGAEQHLLAITVALHPSHVAEVKARLNAVLEQVAALGDDAAGLEGKRVYQVGMQVLPVSLPVE